MLGGCASQVYRHCTGIAAERPWRRIRRCHGLSVNQNKRVRARTNQHTLPWQEPRCEIDADLPVRAISRRSSLAPQKSDAQLPCALLRLLFVRRALSRIQQYGLGTALPSRRCLRGALRRWWPARGQESLEAVPGPVVGTATLLEGWPPRPARATRLKWSESALTGTEKLLRQVVKKAEEKRQVARSTMLDDGTAFSRRKRSGRSKNLYRQKPGPMARLLDAFDLEARVS
jgi:hypothetical protein